MKYRYSPACMVQFIIVDKIGVKNGSRAPIFGPIKIWTFYRRQIIGSCALIKSDKGRLCWAYLY